MNLKIAFLGLLSFVATGVFAQDKIFQSNGNVIDAKIKMIKGDNIIYWHWEDRNGALYALSLQEVDKIHYQSGVEEVFHGSNNKAIPSGDVHTYRPSQYYSSPMITGKEVFSFAPIFFTENGAGIAFSYEKMLDKNGIVSFYLPVIATINTDSKDESKKNKPEDVMVYTGPGIKFYPTGSRGLLKYAVGPSLVFGVGQKTSGGDSYTVWNGQQSQTYTNPYTTGTKTVLGILVNNSLNINPSAHISLGLDFGFGFTYINNVGGVNKGVTGMVQGGFKIGYRY